MPHARNAIRRKAFRRRFSFDALERRQLLAIVRWVGDSGFWDVGANWDNGTGPTNGDEVIINRPTALTVTYRGQGADSVLGLANGETLLIESGTFNILGGQIRSGGLTRVLSGATLNLAGPTTIELLGQTIRNEGTITWTGGNIVQTSGQNLILNDLTGLFDVRTDADATWAGGALTFENRGRLLKSAGAEEAILIPVNSQFTTSGRVETQVGTLAFESIYTQLGNAASETLINGGLFRFGAGSSFQSGVLTGAGAIIGNVTNVQAHITPGGDQIGTISIIGDFIQQAGTETDPATLIIQMHGTTPGVDLDQLIVKSNADPVLPIGGNVTLGGTLSIVTDGFTPVLGQRFPIINQTTSVTGSFLVTNLPPIPPDQFWFIDVQPTGVTLEIVNTIADLSITVNAPTSGTVFEIIRYRVTVTNTGPNGADNVVVTDPLPANVLFSEAESSGNVSFDPVTRIATVRVDFLPPLDSFSSTIALIPLAPLAGTDLINTIRVDSDTPDPNHTNDTVTSVIPIGALVDLVVNLTGPAQLAVGTTGTYTITVKNNGPNVATNVNVFQFLPANTVYIPDASTPGFVQQPQIGAVVFTLPTLGIGATATLLVGMMPTVAATGPQIQGVVALTADQVIFNSATTVDTFTTQLLVAPVITRVSRYGAAPSLSLLVIQFDQAMDVATAQNTANYRVVLAGRDRRFGTRDDINVPVSGAFYNNTNNTVTLGLARRFSLYAFYQVTVFAGATGLRSEQGVSLAGNGSGLPGTNYVARFGHANFRGPVAKLLGTAPNRQRLRRGVRA